MALIFFGGSMKKIIEYLKNDKQFKCQTIAFAVVVLVLTIALIVFAKSNLK